ncbi:MAG: aconitate hydratase [Nitrospinota bacterium]|nr:aconitate hydratase [Nitrospinota bacterium]
MGLNITQKIIKKHLVSGEMKAGEKISIKIDQTLTQDATGTMAYLQFEALDIPRVKTKLSVSYVDHNTLQTGFENADDHLFLQTIAAKHGIYFSRPGNGICHQVHLERFGLPGQTLLGSDSHTPTQGGLAMLAIGAGGLDVALAMGGQPFFLNMPKVVLVNLKGKLRPWVSAKDIILELLRRLTVKGGVGKVFEYGGDGVKSLSVPERATITNMGAELGATTSVFPSDKITKQFLAAEKRVKQWTAFEADTDAEYEEVIEINLRELEPMIAKPHLPDNVCKVKELKKLKVNQVAIGSCTNSSYKDLMTVAKILKGKTIHPNVSLVISPGSRQVLNMISKNGAIADIVTAGGRTFESTCGPCIGMGQAPSTNAVSVRTFNRNFLGRSGTKSAQVYLASPEVAAACAITGKITDPRTLGKNPPKIQMPKTFVINDNMIIPPTRKKVEVIRGPNIKSLPIKDKLPDKLTGKVLLKVEDNITTDHIMPAGAKILPLRSNVPAISEYVFSVVDADFPKRAKESGGGFVVGGANYGQGSSREHAALAPMYLGVKAILTKSFARIHLANLINFGILPLSFANENDYIKIDQGDELELDVSNLNENVILNNITKGIDIPVTHSLSSRDIAILKAGGSLGFAKQQAQ